MRAAVRISLFLALVCVSGILRAAGPGESAFKQDMAYYRKTAKAGNLKANDRLYILDRFRKKYAQAEFDQSELYAEIDRWTSAKEKEKSAAPRAETEEDAEPAAPSVGKLETVIVSDENDRAVLTVESPGTLRTKEILKKDPQGRRPPVLVIYLYNTEEKLQPAEKNQSFKSGLIKQVQAGKVTARPPTVRLSVSLREDRPYQTVKNDVGFTVHFDKASAAEKSAPASAPAGAAAPTLLNPLDSGGFEQEPSTTAAAAPAPVPPPPPAPAPALIEEGDILDIRVSPYKEFSQNVIVDSRGGVELLPLGEFKAAGRTPVDVEAAVAERLKDYVDKPAVTVAVQKPAGKQLYLTGQVKAPGVHDFSAGLTCFEFITKTGGFLADADKRNISVYRGPRDNRENILFDADAYLDGADPSKDMALLPGDLIEVPRSANFVFVIGAVKNEGRYEYKDGLRVLQAVYQAGGFEDKAKRGGKIRVVRGDQGKKITQEIDVRELLKNLPEKDLILGPGDTVIVSRQDPVRNRTLLKKSVPWLAFFGSLALVLGLLL